MAHRATWLSAAGVLGLATLLSCSPAATAPASAPAAPGNPAVPAEPAVQQVSFSADVVPVLTRHCASCHTAGRGPAAMAVEMFSAAGEPQHAVVSAQIGAMIDAIKTGRMPKGRPGSVPAAQVQTLEAWEAAGAPAN